MRTEELVKEVRKHAERFYNAGGWDVIVECWSDEDIRKGIEGCETLAEAVNPRKSSLAAAVSVWAERQADAEFHRREALGEV